MVGLTLAGFIFLADRFQGEVVICLFFIALKLQDTGQIHNLQFNIINPLARVFIFLEKPGRADGGRGLAPPQCHKHHPMIPPYESDRSDVSTTPSRGSTLRLATGNTT